MPICSYGGAKCFAGPASEVHEHEISVHKKQKNNVKKQREGSYNTKNGIPSTVRNVK